MLSSGDVGHRLEPVGIVGCTVLHSPIPHSSRYGAGNGTVELGAHALCQLQALIHIAGQSLGHYGIAEYLDAIDLGNIHTLSSFLLET